MTDTQTATIVSRPRKSPELAANLQIPSPLSHPLPGSSLGKVRNGHLTLDSFSPVNQNGSFEFDRVLKCGSVLKRTRKTKAWKPIYLVLRPNILSIYKNENETKLRHKVHLSDLTAVAYLKDPKQKRQNVFGLFSPSRNYHLEALSKKDAEEWVELIRQEARIEEEEEEMFLASPVGNITRSFSGFEQDMARRRDERQAYEERVCSSSPEPAEPFPRLPKPKPGGLNLRRRPSHTMEYSGNEVASHSDMSDVDNHRAAECFTAIPQDDLLAAQSLNAQRPILNGRNFSQMSGFNAEQDPERVAWQGHLLYLKTKGGVRQWKDLWAVLRPRSFALYKDEAEYVPRLIIPLSAIINAVEIDPLSKSKIYCMQIITEEKSYKFCAHDEETLDKSLGSFKSLLSRRKDNEGKRAVGPR